MFFIEKRRKTTYVDNHVIVHKVLKYLCVFSEQMGKLI